MFINTKTILHDILEWRSRVGQHQLCETGVFTSYYAQHGVLYCNSALHAQYGPLGMEGWERHWVYEDLSPKQCSDWAHVIDNTDSC